MSIFNEVSASNSEDRNYPYYKYIKSPDQLGASSKGSITALGNDINAMKSYVEVLVTGQTKGQTVSPLGNKYFMNTGTTCISPDGSTQPRNIYINNVPSGSIPFISSSMGVNMSNFKGLVPGVIEDLSYINPMKLFTAFSSGTDCQQITMETRDISNNVMDESKYVLNEDIIDYDACWFKDKKNPISKIKCVEAMTLPKDPMLQTYTTCIGLLGIYILYSLFRKTP
jgi:hypothetical protein